MRNPPLPPERPPADDDTRQAQEPASRSGEAEVGPLEPIRLPSLHRRHRPWLLVEVDGSGSAQGPLSWALREAARREATVLAVTVLGEEPRHGLGAGRPGAAGEHEAALQRLEAQVLRAIAETGVHGRARTAVLERPVFEALSDAASGADLVIVGQAGKTLLRQAVARPPFRRLPRGA